MTPASAAAAARSPSRRSASDGVVPAGSSTVVSSQRGSRAGGGDVVGVDEHGERPEVGAGERDGVAVRDEDLVADHVEGGHVLADPGADEHGGVARAVPGTREVARPAGRWAACPAGSGRPRRTTPSSSPRRADDEVAVRRRRGVVRVPAPPAASPPLFVEVGGHGAGRVARPARRGGSRRRRAARSGGTPSRRAACSTPSGAGLGGRSSSRVTIDVEVGGASSTRSCSGRRRGSTAARPLRVSTPSRRPSPRSRAHELLGARVGLGLRCAGELEPLEGGERGVALAALRQRQDALEHERVRRAADLALDGGEVERARAG